MKLSLGRENWMVKQNRQQGFTLVNMAMAIVGSGFLLSAAGPVSQWWNASEYEHFYQEMRDLENVLWQYRQRHGQWPGDCDADGVIGHQPAVAARADSDEDSFYDDTLTLAQSACQRRQAGLEGVDTPFSELRRSGLLAAQKSNLLHAKHNQGDFFQIGHTRHEQGTSNLMVAYGVPVSLALWMDERVDGHADGGEGRLRRWDTSESDQAWPAADTEQRVAISYYFERKIP